MIPGNTFKAGAAVLTILRVKWPYAIVITGKGVQHVYNIAGVKTFKESEV